jgi:hypothetical protein
MPSLWRVRVGCAALWRASHPLHPVVLIEMSNALRHVAATTRVHGARRGWEGTPGVTSPSRIPFCGEVPLAFRVSEEASTDNQLVALQRKLQEYEMRRIDAERKAEERTRRRGLSRSTVSLLTQRRKIVFLSTRKEVIKPRSQNAQVRTGFDLLKDNNQRLMDASGASFADSNRNTQRADEGKRTAASYCSRVTNDREHLQYREKEKDTERSIVSTSILYIVVY